MTYVSPCRVPVWCNSAACCEGDQQEGRWSSQHGCVESPPPGLLHDGTCEQNWFCTLNFTNIFPVQVCHWMHEAYNDGRGFNGCKTGNRCYMELLRKHKRSILFALQILQGHANRWFQVRPTLTSHSTCWWSMRTRRRRRILHLQGVCPVVGYLQQYDILTYQVMSQRRLLLVPAESGHWRRCSRPNCSPNIATGKKLKETAFHPCFHYML